MPIEFENKQMKKHKVYQKEKATLRYGKFSLKPYLVFFVVVSVFLAYATIRNINNLWISIAILLILFCRFFLTQYESYRIDTEKIDAIKPFSRKCIPLTNGLVLIVAKTNMLIWPSNRFSFYRRNVVELHDRYVICIVSNCSVDEALKVIHQYDYPENERYYNEFIKELFGKTVYHDFLYSFVFDPQQVQKLAANHNCQIILPKSLEGKVDLSGLNIPIHVDEEG